MIDGTGEGKCVGGSVVRDGLGVGTGVGFDFGFGLVFDF
jgi:hypothetical protein